MKSTHLKTHGRNLILGNCRVIVDDVGQRTTLHELHHHPQLRRFFLQESVKEVHNVLVSTLLHNDDLVDDELLAWLVP